MQAICEQSHGCSCNLQGKNIYKIYEFISVILIVGDRNFYKVLNSKEVIEKIVSAEPSVVDISLRSIVPPSSPPGYRPRASANQSVYFYKATAKGPSSKLDPLVSVSVFFGNIIFVCHFNLSSFIITPLPLRRGARFEWDYIGWLQRR